MTSDELRMMNTKNSIEATRENLFLPGVWDKIFSDDALGAIVYRNGNDVGGIRVTAFSNKRVRPDFQLRFKTPERAEKYQNEWYQRLVAAARVAADRKKARAALVAQPHTLTVGDVLVASWGYEQTNYDYYQVTGLVGRRSVQIRELAQQSAETGFLQGDCVPRKNVFKGEPMTKQVNPQNAIKVKRWGVWARKKEATEIAGMQVFKPDHYTAYA